MSEDNLLLSDDQIIALTRKKFRQRKIGSLLLLPVCFGAGLATRKFFAWHSDHQPAFREFLVPGICVLLLLAASATIFHFTRPPKGAYTTRILVNRADELQWQVRRFLLVVVPFSLLMFAVVAEIETMHVLNHGFRMMSCLKIAPLFLFGIVVLSFLTPYGIKRAMRPVLDDELSKSMRLRALSLGFWVVTPGIAALFGLSLYDRNLAIEMMILLLYLAVAVPALRYCYLDWRAAREGK